MLFIFQNLLSGTDYDRAIAVFLIYVPGQQFGFYSVDMLEINSTRPAGIIKSAFLAE
jgi:hypothetical protein